MLCSQRFSQYSFARVLGSGDVMAELSVKKHRSVGGKPVRCDVCGMEVRTRGLANHKTSRYCKVMGTIKAAESRGLVPIGGSVLQFFLRHKLPVEYLDTRIETRAKAIILTSSTKNKPQAWGSRAVSETYRICTQVKDERISMTEGELASWRERHTLSAQSLGDIPEDVRAADAEMRLRRVIRDEQ
jgi:hypothetical protein